MQPQGTTTIRRAFHWGLVVVMGRDWAGPMPELDPDVPVTASDGVLLIPVRHAQDADEAHGEDEPDWFARAEIVVRRWATLPAEPGSVDAVFRGTIDVPNGDLTVGDADEWVTVPVGSGRSAVVVSFDAGATSEAGPDRVWIDLAMVPSA